MENNEVLSNLWKQAQEQAKNEYEEIYRDGSWEDADKYEKEDWVFAVYFRTEKKV